MVLFSILNISSIGPADLRLWKKGAHVRTCQPKPSLTSTICRSAWCHSAYLIWALSAQRIPRYGEGVRTCARANQCLCQPVQTAYKHGVIQHTKYERYRPSRSTDMKKGYARAHVQINVFASPCNMLKNIVFFTILNMSAIGPSDPHILRRGTHVRTCMHSSLPTCAIFIFTWCPLAYKIWALSAQQIPRY